MTSISLKPLNSSNELLFWNILEKILQISDDHRPSNKPDLCIMTFGTPVESAMIEIAQTSTAARLRNFFVTAVICCEPARPDTLLDTFFDALSEDFVLERRRIHADQNLGTFNYSHYYTFSYFYL